MIDQYLMENYLLVLKSTVEVYVHGTLESSNINIRNLLKNCLDNTMNSQANTYDKMSEHGFYKVENINKSVIKNALNKIKGQ